MEVTILKVLDMGNDTLKIIGTIDEVVDKDGKLIELQAFGWFSAMMHHYDASDYGEEGHRKEGAMSREMTSAEKLAYCQRLLVEQNPIPREIELF